MRPASAEVARVTSLSPEPDTPSHQAGGIISQLRRRKVCRTAISYVLVMWLNLQIGDVMFPMIGLPDWCLSLVITIGVMGFPVVLILAWAFQITSHGIVLDEGDAGDRESGTERHLDTAVNLLLLLSAVALSVLLLVQFLGSPDPSSTADATPARRPEGVVIASLTLTPTTDLPGNRALAAGVVGELSHRLINLDGIELLATELAVDPADARPHLSLTGTVLLESDSAYVLAQLIDVDSGRYLDSVKLTLPVDSLHRAESQAAEGIVAALRGALLPGSPAAALATTPRPPAGVARARHDRPAAIDSPQR